MARLFNGTTDRGTATVDLSAFSLISLSFWMWSDLFTGASRDAITYGSPTASGAGFLIEPFDTQPLVVGMFKPGNVWADFLSTPPAVGSWHHYLWIGDRTALTNTLYLDGLVQSLTTFAHQGSGYGNYANTGSKVLELGSYNNTQFFSGRLAEVAIWGGVALSATDAQALANKALPSAQHPLNFVGYWPLAGGQSPEPDVSGQGNGSITFTAFKPVQGPIYTNQGLPPAMPPIVRGHPAMRRHRAFFSSSTRIDPATITLAGTSSLLATATPLQRFTISIGGTSALTATATPLQRITVTLAGTSTLAATVTPKQTFTVTIAGSSSLAASLTRYQRFTVALAGTGALTAALTPYQRITPTLAGTSALTVALTPYQRLTATLAGSSSLSTTITPYQRLTASLAGSSTLSATIIPYERITPTLAGTSTLAATVTPYQTLTASLTGHGSLTATVTAYQGLVANLAGTSALTATLSAYVPLTPSLAGTSTLTGTLTPVGPTGTSSGLAGQRRRVRIDPRIRRDEELLILLSTVL